MSLAPVNLVVALPAEAKPLISAFGLKRLQPERGFPIYRSDTRHLVVSTPGKIAAAAATALLHAVAGYPERAIWINLGIAGHIHQALGEGFIANRITDAANGRTWEPAIATDHPALPTEQLLTVDQPDFDYQWPGIVDMEAAGFYPTACRFTHPALVHCLKIVSDNPNQPARQISARRVSQWVAGQRQRLELLIGLLDATRGPM